MISLTDIKKFYAGTSLFDEPMATTLDESWWSGGFLYRTGDRNDLISIVEYFRESQLFMVILGRGSNVLISDEGIRGAVFNIENSLADIRRENI